MERTATTDSPGTRIRVFKLGRRKMEPTNLVGTVITTDKDGLTHVRWNRETTTAAQLEKLLRTH